jgi:hypothetical protein
MAAKRAIPTPDPRGASVFSKTLPSAINFCNQGRVPCSARFRGTTTAVNKPNRRVLPCHRSPRVDFGIVFLAAAIFPISRASAQAPSLQEQLAAQYTPVKMGADSNGPAVVEAGTVLNIKKGGILSVPYGDTSVVPTKYQDGTVHSPNSALMKGIGFGLCKDWEDANHRVFAGGHKSLSLQDRRQCSQRSGGHERRRLRFL